MDTRKNIKIILNQAIKNYAKKVDSVIQGARVIQADKSYETDYKIQIKAAKNDNYHEEPLFGITSKDMAEEFGTLKAEFDFFNESIKEIIYDLQPKITEDELDTISAALEKNRSEEAKVLQAIQNAPLAENRKTTPFPATVTIDNETGLSTISPLSENDDLNISLGTVASESEEFFSDADITQEMSGEVSDFFNIDDKEEILEIMDILNRFKKGEKIKYNDLPKSAKPIVSQLAQVTNKEEATKDFLKLAVNNILGDKAYVDLNNAVAKYMNVDIVDMYGEYLRERFENTYTKQIAEAKDTKVKEKLEGVYASFQDSYKLTSLLEFIENNKSFVRKLNKEVKRLNRWVTEFNFKYKDVKFKQPNILLIVNPIMRVFEPEITLEEAEKIVVLIAKMCQNMNPKNVVEHSLMYYLVFHMIHLDHMKSNEEFTKEYVGNLTKVFNRIREIEADK